MPRRPELPGDIALFPLSGAVLLPRTRLPLQIFEPRYLQMVEDVLKTRDRLIGMIQPVESGPDRLAQIGCAGRIVAFSEVGDGRLMISLRAQSRFRLRALEPRATPYLHAHVDWSGFEADLATRPECAGQFDRDALIARLIRYARRHGLASDWSAAETSDEETLVNSLSMLLPFPPGDKQALLESPTLADRRELLDGLLEYALRGGDDEEIVQ
ncbi:LON peptidase substrate-binding domain-containing protein [Paracoccus sp. CPCC 101403]|uniref:LON peptidase substrate-binding domain-containing protein n=1 Tax=Paracoccus broussonetiae TaxID=3075834 RepID=A0ABU3EG07_9RHOB|nr:LON peptidase substrate-binding domain-containing protein [Paracoccus sp. CPCC 101403]MDT1063178.1 LON peptidase substrate-binding domain-containing protein [Paracoccus sp. CPCC 101403]